MAAERTRLARAALAGLVLLLPLAAGAQSAADLAGRITIDGRTSDWQPPEAALWTPELCDSLPPGTCSGTEEPPGDGPSGALQDVRQLHVTWDARFLYLAVDATLGGAALLALVDVRPGGLADLSALDTWRCAVRTGPEIRPDYLIAVGDATSRPEVYRARGEATVERVDAESFAGVASFEGEAPGRALEIALPWTVLFPGAPAALDPEPGAPPEPMAVLPADASAHGLRVAAVIVPATPGWGALDVAPDPTLALATDPRQWTVVDRAVRVDWDANAVGPPHFVDFGAAVQLQGAPRLVPTRVAPPAALVFSNLRTYSGSHPGRLLAAGTGPDLAFAFDVGGTLPAEVWISAAVYTVRGERIRELARDARRTAGTPAAPWGPFGDPAVDRWDGRDGAGHLVSGGHYVLRVQCGVAPGAPLGEERTAVTVVR